MLLRPGFIDLCRQWINRQDSTNLTDVYDGEIWKTHMSIRETIFGPFPTPLYNQLECNSSFRPVKIHHFGSVSFSVGDEVSNLPIAVCLWYLPHQQFGRIGKPVQIWCADKFEHPSYYCFVPIHLIKQCCSYSKICINDEWLLQLIPLIE